MILKVFFYEFEEMEYDVFLNLNFLNYLEGKWGSDDVFLFFFFL